MEVSKYSSCSHRDVTPSRHEWHDSLRVRHSTARVFGALIAIDRIGQVDICELCKPNREEMDLALLDSGMLLYAGFFATAVAVNLATFAYFFHTSWLVQLVSR